MLLYHVTAEKHVAAILRHGLRTPKQSGTTRNWVNLFGSALGARSCIYAFDDYHDAILWGHKMQFDLKLASALVTFERGEAWLWTHEANFRHEGRSLFTSQRVELEQIEAIEIIMPRMVRAAIQLQRQRERLAAFKARQRPLFERSAPRQALAP